MWRDLETSLRESRRCCPEPDSEWMRRSREAALAGHQADGFRLSVGRGRSWRLDRRWLTVIVVAVVCGVTVGVAVAASHRGSGVPPSRSVDWAGTFGPGSRSVTLATAASLLAFTPVAPQGVSAPTVVYVNREPLPRRSVELQFNDPTYGVFRLDESPAQVTQAQLLAEATCPAETTCPSALSIASLTAGVQGLSISGSTSTGLMWIQGGVVYDAYGPPKTFSTKDAVAIADQILTPTANTPFN
jgi:hypothetical protein